MSIIPDDSISGTPDTPNSPVADVRPTGPGWIVPVPKKPTDPKPSVTIKLTDDPEGVNLIEVNILGNVEKATILAQLPGSEEFQPIVGATNVSKVFKSTTFDKVKAVKVILEEKSEEPNGNVLPDENYNVQVEIKACFKLPSKNLPYLFIFFILLEFSKIKCFPLLILILEFSK